MTQPDIYLLGRGPPTANARARLLDMGTSFTRTVRLDGALQRSAKKTPATCAADILVRPNLMTWNAAVYCTQVDPDTVMVSGPCVWLGSKEFTRRSSVESTCWLRRSQHARRLC